jgi:hypothetical protein
VERLPRFGQPQGANHQFHVSRGPGRRPRQLLPLSGGHRAATGHSKVSRPHVRGRHPHPGVSPYDHPVRWYSDALACRATDLFRKGTQSVLIRDPAPEEVFRVRWRDSRSRKGSPFCFNQCQRRRIGWADRKWRHLTPDWLRNRADHRDKER